MAGSLQMVVSASESFGCSATSTEGQWEVQFSRIFVHRISPSSSCPHLVPLRNRRKKCTWLSSDSPASLQLLESSCEGGAILTVFLRGKMMEEHFISKLHFTWPHVSCMSGFPARGSRAVFISYRDCAGEIQKFAVRFLTSCDAEAFINVLRKSLHCLNDVAENEILSTPIASEISSHSEFVPSDSPIDRCQEKMDTVPASGQEPKVSQVVHNHDAEVPLAITYPPSFTSLLTSYPVVPLLAFFLFLQMYMEDSAFQEMLMAVDRVMEELEADLVEQSHKPQHITW
ncbi:hypothetical protein SAY86_022582 [Trapa natans]|uniref:Poor homologous synapsis 1 PH domain-containing protein n=1 Tax=Trapa natans TaxID=22666 RepID=A0AAN7LTR1_TRANT|nr:hypothetical protein SAY86_022582 [Trapa natans]